MNQTGKTVVGGVTYYDGLRMYGDDKGKAPALIAIFAAAPVLIGLYGLVDVLSKFFG